MITDNSATTTTAYAGSYTYEDSSLKFMSHAEGYIEPDGAGYDYIYQYKDIWGNTRITYSDANDNGSVDTSEIRREQNYYPFGLQHKGYNNVTNGAEYNYKTYQGQEIHKELGLDAIEFKYRFYYPDIGRFWSIDPLSDQYVYNSTYAFSENKLGMGIELEGLEVMPFDLVFYAMRKGQEVVDKFSGGTQRVTNATLSPMSQATQTTDPDFDPQEQRIARATEIAKGGNDMVEAASDAGHLVLDVAGAAEPTGIVDGAHSLWYAAEGDYLNASLTAAGIVPYLGDASKLLKYSDEVADLVKVTGKVEGGKEIISVLKEGTLENGLKVANDAIGGLGDAAVEVTGKFGNQKDVVTGYKSGKKGWRIDYDPKKGGHINWWNGKQKGAILLNAGENQINQIIKNELFR